MKLIYFGEEYYYASGSSIGALYHEDGTRSDWGKVSGALREGEKVEIRSATPAEHREMAKICRKEIKRLKAAGWSGPWDAAKRNPSRQIVEARHAAQR